MPKLEKKVIQTITPQELQALRKACLKETYPELQIRDHAAIDLLYETGIRAGELVGLTIENTCLKPGVSYVRVQGKGVRSAR